MIVENSSFSSYAVTLKNCACFALGFLCMDEDIRASWEAANNEVASPKGNHDQTNPFTTKRDADINYHERYEVASPFVMQNGAVHGETCIRHHIERS